MAAVTVDTALSVTATPSTTVVRKTGVDTALAVTATPTPGILRGVNLTAGLTVTASTTAVTNQRLSVGTALKVTATPKSALFPPVEYFTVTADLLAIVADYIDTDTHPDQQPISATITFTPRLSLGQVIWIPGQGVVLAPIKARFDTDGILRTIIGGTGVELTANTPILGLPTLIYDVAFTNIVYNKADQYIAPFAFTALTVGGGILDLASVTRLPPRIP
jgi:hypothetical protein